MMLSMHIILKMIHYLDTISAVSNWRFTRIPALNGITCQRLQQEISLQNLEMERGEGVLTVFVVLNVALPQGSPSVPLVADDRVKV